MTRAALDDGIKTAALEALVLGELAQHLVMNRARLITYEQVRSEIQAWSLHRSPPKPIRIQDSCDQRAPQIRWRWTALTTEARKARKGKVMSRTARKKVNIRTRI